MYTYNLRPTRSNKCTVWPPDPVLPFSHIMRQSYLLTQGLAPASIRKPVSWRMDTFTNVPLRLTCCWPATWKLVAPRWNPCRPAGPAMTDDDHRAVDCFLLLKDYREVTPPPLSGPLRKEGKCRSQLIEETHPKCWGVRAVWCAWDVAMLGLWVLIYLAVCDEWSMYCSPPVSTTSWACVHVLFNRIWVMWYINVFGSSLESCSQECYLRYLPISDWCQQSEMYTFSIV